MPARQSRYRLKRVAWFSARRRVEVLGGRSAAAPDAAPWENTCRTGSQKQERIYALRRRLSSEIEMRSGFLLFSQRGRSGAAMERSAPAPGAGPWRPFALFEEHFPNEKKARPLPGRGPSGNASLPGDGYDVTITTSRILRNSAGLVMCSSMTPSTILHS